MISTLYDHPELFDALQPASESQLSFYSTLALRYPEAVLALACGSGQIIVPIAAKGIPVTGLDQSSKMLSAARSRASAAGTNLEFIEGDMRDFNLERQFSLIFVARNSLLHLSEPTEFVGFFSSVRHHLKPGGVLAFDVFNPSGRVLAVPTGQRYQVMHKVSPLHGEVTVEATNDYDSCSQVNRGTWFISTAETRDAWVLPLHLRSIFPQELLVLLAANGFRLVRRDGDFVGGAFVNSSANQVCQCQVA